NLEIRTMNTRQLGASDLHITPIGLGAWAIGGPGYAFGWGDQDDRDSVAAIHEALDTGIHWIDTAAVYRLGHSEVVVARAPAGLGGGRYVSPRGGRFGGQAGEVSFRLKADWVRRECEASLRRLGVEAIDLYQIHWPRPDEDIEEGWATLAALQKEGKVRH